MSRERAREPLARGVVVPTAAGVAELQALAKECLSILRAVDAAAETAPAASGAGSGDFLALLVTADVAVDRIALPELKDRAATAIAVGAETAACRAALTAVRKRLRGAGATLGPHELVLAPADFGHLGLESDALREKLEILLRTLVADAERLRLKREGWEEPAE